MSGHSHYATIKRKKETEDQKRGKIFSKLSKAISVSVKTGGGPNLESNSKLRVAVEQAKASNMPKANIDRAISRASEVGNLEEITYEGFGPEGINIMIEVATDNRNRVAQELKSFFDRGGGSMGSPGSVSFNFDPKGMLLVKKTADLDKQILDLIDAGVEDIEDTDDGIEVYVDTAKTSDTKEALMSRGFEVIAMQLVQKPKTFQTIDNAASASKIIAFLDKLEDNDDVQKVFANINIPDEILDSIDTS